MKSKGKFAQDNKGKWMINTQVKVDGVWKHFTKRGYDTLGEAKADYIRAEQEFISGHTKHHEIKIWDDLVNEYLEDKRKIVNQNTISQYTSVLKYCDCFKGKLIATIFSLNSVRSWYKDITNRDSIKMINLAIVRFKDILLHAYNHKYIDSESYQECDIVLNKVKDDSISKERVIWSPDELKSFKEAIKVDYRDYVMFNTMIALGCRVSEFLAIKVSNIDLDNKFIKIDSQVTHDGSLYVVTNTLKTKNSYRSVPISNELVGMLYDYIYKFGLKENECLWFSMHSRKTPITQAAIVQKLNKYCESAKVRKINTHALRHMMATKLASVCKTSEDVEACASILGHSPSMFMNTYANHSKENTKKELMFKIGLN